MKKTKNKFEKMHQQLENVSEMLNSRIYNLLIEFADMRGELRELRRCLWDIEKNEEKSHSIK